MFTILYAIHFVINCFKKKKKQPVPYLPLVLRTRRRPTFFWANNLNILSVHTVYVLNISMIDHVNNGITATALNSLHTWA